jgi:hypothetical protein
VAIRFYVDADLIGLGKLLVQVRTVGDVAPATQAASVLTSGNARDAPLDPGATAG